MIDDNEPTTDTTVNRREAIKKAAGIGAAAGVVWAAPSVNGMSLVPGFAAAASQDEPITASGTATKTAGCFSGATIGGDDRFYAPLGDGWWGFYFQGCSLGDTETVALDVQSTPIGDAYQPPTGYRCRMQINTANGSYDTGWVDDPINGIADTGGVVFIGTSEFPNNAGNTVGWQITCESL